MTLRPGLPALAVLALLSSASAQRVAFPNGVYDLQACYRVAQGTKCDFLYTPLQEQSMSFITSWFVAVEPDGRNVQANALSVANGNWTTYPGSIKTFTNVPVKVSALFPVQALSFPVLTVASSPMRNITVGGPATSTPPQTVSAASASYNAVLTNCKTQAGGVLVCTATLTPRK